MNRTFHPDSWPTWLDEVETLGGRQITDGPTVDALYERYMADQTPLVAAIYVFGESARERARTPHAPIRPAPDPAFFRGLANAAVATLLAAALVGLLIYKAAHG